MLARSRHKVVLTECGKRYLVNVRRLLGEIQAATQSLQAHNTRPAVTLAAAPEITSYWLMPRLGAFHARHPEIAVNLVSWTRAEDASLPAGSECAIQCVDQPSAGLADDMLFAEELVPVAAPCFLADNPVAAPTALMNLPLILQIGRHHLWLDWFAQLGLRPERPLEGNSHNCLSLVLEAALNGHGVALAPAFIVRDLLDDDRLRIVFNARLATDRIYVLSVDPAFARQNAVRRFQKWLAETVNTTSRPID